VCDRWASYETFFFDMGDPPIGHSLERKDNALGYGPENCIWATPKVQSRNRRNTHRIVICGRDMSIAEACDVHGLKLSTVNSRANKKQKPHIEAFYDLLGTRIDPQFRLRKGRLTRRFSGPLA
jgi:hypothetical protein